MPFNDDDTINRDVPRWRDLPAGSQDFGLFEDRQLTEDLNKPLKAPPEVVAEQAMATLKQVREEKEEVERMRAELERSQTLRQQQSQQQQMRRVNWDRILAVLFAMSTVFLLGVSILQALRIVELNLRLEFVANNQNSGTKGK